MRISDWSSDVCSSDLYKIEYEYARYWRLSPGLIMRTGINIGYGDAYMDPITRDLCYTAPTPPTEANPTPPAPPPPSDPCSPSSPDYAETVTADGLPFLDRKSVV